MSATLSHRLPHLSLHHPHRPHLSHQLLPSRLPSKGYIPMIDFFPSAVYQYIISNNKNNFVIHGGTEQVMWSESLLQMTSARSRVFRGLLGSSVLPTAWEVFLRAWEKLGALIFNSMGALSELEWRSWRFPIWFWHRLELVLAMAALYYRTTSLYQCSSIKASIFLEGVGRIYLFTVKFDTLTSQLSGSW